MKTTTKTILSQSLIAAVLLFSATIPAKSAVITIENADFRQLYTNDTKTTPVTFSGDFTGGTSGFASGSTTYASTGSASSSPVFVPGWQETLGYGPGDYAAGVVINVPNDFYGGYISNASNARMAQTLTATLQANTIYTLSFQLALGAPVVSFSAGGNLLTATSSTTPAAGGQLSPTTQTYVFDSSNLANSGFVGGTLGISLTSGSQVEVTNFSLNAVPEPSAVALIVLGIGALAVRRRSSRKA